MNVTITKVFKKNFKKIRRDKKWSFIFNDEINLNGIKATRWEHVIKYCFIEENRIPAYFNNHQINITRNTKKVLAKKLGMTPNKINCLELHLNGQNGDCLLIYSKSKREIVLINIGSHSSVFKRL